MLLTFARHELGRRRKQTVIVAVGLAIAVALLMVVHSMSAGVATAQSDVLSSVYGVGTDITVTQKPSQQSGQHFQFNPQNSDASNSTSTTALRSSPGNETFDASELQTVQQTSGVSAATAVLNLEQVTLNSDSSSSTSSSSASSSGSTSTSGGFGGGRPFDMNQTSVTGIMPGTTLGPLSTLSASSGRMLESGDDGKLVALVSSDYASSNSLSVGSNVTIANQQVNVVGIVTSTSSSISDIYVPLTTAQNLSGDTGKISQILVQASNASQVDTVASALGKALPSATVSTQSSLASSITGSLGSAAKLISSLGTWVSIGVLIVAFGLAVLFTVSGVNQRTRDFGTLKAIGWRKRQIIGQVATESMLRAAIGGIVGIVLGLVATLIINAAGITLDGSSGGFSMRRGGAETGGAPEGMPTGNAAGSGGGSGMSGAAKQAGHAVSVVLHSPISGEMIVIGLAVAIAGGLLAGIIGGWRAARLRPAVALRSVA